MKKMRVFTLMFSMMVYCAMYLAKTAHDAQEKQPPTPSHTPINLPMD